MLSNSMNIPPVSIATAKAALIEQYGNPTLRQRASMLWGARGVGKSSVVRQVAAHFNVPLVDLRLTTIEPVDIRGAIYVDDIRRKTVWFPPEFLPDQDQPRRITISRRTHRGRSKVASLSIFVDSGSKRRQLSTAARLAHRRRRQRQLSWCDQPRYERCASGQNVSLQRELRNRSFSRLCNDDVVRT